MLGYFITAIEMKQMYCTIGDNLTFFLANTCKLSLRGEEKLHIRGMIPERFGRCMGRQASWIHTEWSLVRAYCVGFLAPAGSRRIPAVAFNL